MLEIPNRHLLFSITSASAQKGQLETVAIHIPLPEKIYLFDYITLVSTVGTLEAELNIQEAARYSACSVLYYMHTIVFEVCVKPEENN